MVFAYVGAVKPARMPRRRPLQAPLSALRGFESAGRLLSFTAAARELNVTQSSISRQIAGLESEVGKPLFVRKTRALELTVEGERLLREVRDCLAMIDRVVDDVRGVRVPARVSIATYASFASLWLVPRLAAFQHAHPGIEIRIDAADRHVDLEAEAIDLAIRWTPPDRAPKSAELLLEEYVTPALSPELLERTGVKLSNPGDLLQLPLLELDNATAASAASSWRRWFKSVGVASDGAPPTAGRMSFTFIDQSMQAAVRGQGVVLGRTPFIDDFIAAGSLTSPFKSLRMRTGFCYFLLENPNRREAPHVRAFRSWLLEEFRNAPRPDASA
jgi:LysR family transcriptional regulator, glycine cleavage system transcriptional activator